MKFADITQRLTGLGSAKWAVHMRARALRAEGRDIVELTIGEPDVPPVDALIEDAANAMRAGRMGYSNGMGEPGLRAALARRYTASTGRDIHPDQVMCLPGTQTSLFTTLLGLVQEGDEVLVGDPMYATYEGCIRASGAAMVPVPLAPENAFRMTAADLEARITSRSRAILLNTPHNPTGAVLTQQDIREIGEVACKHDLWIISDEVYEELIFDGVPFASPLAEPELADRTVVVSSISKSHAAPGFRSGWAIGSTEFTASLLPLSETMLFGSQPFLADATAAAVSAPSTVAPGMRQRFAARAGYLATRLENESALTVSRPQAGMFALIDVSSTGMAAEAYAFDLLESSGVAVMPGTSFGTTLDTWVRVALTTSDDALEVACDRIIAHAAAITASASAAQ
ncbi:pyridoxal phosphate-dependent aminotransferase [Roseovarius arcticus]|uniref:pyridoxal phosphate-dependent aminotransferase n=1 Tax=Roseovarius arcticus TaxID=2547404 RepID=UPI0011108ACE|nr:aminotransferase class I/II-fold pyridoxal phosphate-dependent enzyme [Roseovarius arcticus]